MFLWPRVPVRTRQIEPGLEGVTFKRVRFLDHPVQIA
jgi:hypothetical protein